MLNIVCCLPREHDIDPLRFCCADLFVRTEGEWGLLTGPPARFEGFWAAPTPASARRLPAAAPAGGLPLELSGPPEAAKEGRCSCRRKGKSGRRWAVAPWDASMRAEPALHGTRGDHLLSLPGPAAIPTFCKFVCRATAIVQLKVSEPQGNRVESCVASQTVL